MEPVLADRHRQVFDGPKLFRGAGFQTRDRMPDEGDCRGAGVAHTKTVGSDTARDLYHQNTHHCSAMEAADTTGELEAGRTLTKFMLLAPRWRWMGRMNQGTAYMREGRDEPGLLYFKGVLSVFWWTFQVKWK